MDFLDDNPVFRTHEITCRSMSDLLQEVHNNLQAREPPPKNSSKSQLSNAVAEGAAYTLLVAGGQ